MCVLQMIHKIYLQFTWKHGDMWLVRMWENFLARKVLLDLTQQLNIIFSLSQFSLRPNTCLGICMMFIQYVPTFKVSSTLIMSWIEIRSYNCYGIIPTIMFCIVKRSYKQSFILQFVLFSNKIAFISVI